MILSSISYLVFQHLLFLSWNNHTCSQSSMNVYSVILSLHGRNSGIEKNMQRVWARINANCPLWNGIYPISHLNLSYFCLGLMFGLFFILTWKELQKREREWIARILKQMKGKSLIGTKPKCRIGRFSYFLINKREAWGWSLRDVLRLLWALRLAALCVGCARYCVHLLHISPFYSEWELGPSCPLLPSLSSSPLLLPSFLFLLLTFFYPSPFVSPFIPVYSNIPPFSFPPFPSFPPLHPTLKKLGDEIYCEDLQFSTYTRT